MRNTFTNFQTSAQQSGQKFGNLQNNYFNQNGGLVVLQRPESSTLMYISENEGRFGKNMHKQKSRLLYKKRFKDEQEVYDNREVNDRYEESDPDMKILESDYSSSTFHLASRSSVVASKQQMRTGTGQGSRMSMQTHTHTTGFYDSN